MKWSRQHNSHGNPRPHYGAASSFGSRCTIDVGPRTDLLGAGWIIRTRAPFVISTRKPLIISFWAASSSEKYGLSCVELSIGHSGCRVRARGCETGVPSLLLKAKVQRKHAPSYFLCSGKFGSTETRLSSRAPPSPLEHLQTELTPKDGHGSKRAS